MFSFLNLNRRYPNNAALSRYCTESTNNSIRKLTQEYNEEKKGILIKKYFNNKKEEESNKNNLSQNFIIYSGVFSTVYFILDFLFNRK